MFESRRTTITEEPEEQTIKRRTCVPPPRQLDQQYNQFKLRSIMSEHKKTITAISWCPDNLDLFASASADNLLIVWNVAEKKAVARLDNTKGEQTGLGPRPP